MGKNLIIAAYDRNYDWIDQVNSDVKITVYNKNEQTLKNSEILISPNVGRCVHTFFWHIVNNYDNLDDYIITSQDMPFDHNNDYVSIINGDETFWNNRCQQNFGECWFFCIQHGILTCDMNGLPQHGDLDITSVWARLFDEAVPEFITFTPTGHFVASKNHIKNRPLFFYKRILNILATEQLSPWILERLEPYIFNLSYKIVQE